MKSVGEAMSIARTFPESLQKGIRSMEVKRFGLGLDANDNEFVLGLIGKELHPLSHVVQTMRKTRQTSQYIVQMGPFFVGHVEWRSSRR